MRENIQGTTKPANRGLARRGGVKRMSDDIYEEIRGVVGHFLENVIHDSVTYTEHAVQDHHCVRCCLCAEAPRPHPLRFLNFPV
jgi:hypothetical protein